MLDSFFTLDLRTWRYDEAEVPRETWADVQKRLVAIGKDETELGQARTDWEEEQKRKQKDIHRANRRKMRRERLRRRKHKSESIKLGESDNAAIAPEEELTDEEAIAAREAEKAQLKCIPPLHDLYCYAPACRTRCTCLDVRPTVCERTGVRSAP